MASKTPHRTGITMTEEEFGDLLEQNKEDLQNLIKFYEPIPGGGILTAYGLGDGPLRSIVETLKSKPCEFEDNYGGGASDEDKEDGDG